MKSLSWGITEANVQQPTVSASWVDRTLTHSRPLVRRFPSGNAVYPAASPRAVFNAERRRDGGHHNLFFDEGNVAAAFHVAGLDIPELLGFRGQTQVFFDIVSGDVIPSHGAQNQITVLDD
jgi:hypothetical protein